MTVYQAIILDYIIQVFVLVVGLVGLMKWKQLTKSLRLLDFYILFSFVITVVDGVLGFNNIRNLWVNHWFTIIGLFLYSCIYYSWRPSKRYGQLLWLAFPVYLLIWIIGKFTFEPFYYADVYSGAVSQIIQMVFGGWLLYEISKGSNFDWIKDYRFLVVSGIAIYAAATFFLYTSFNLMLTLPRPIMRLIWKLNSVFIVIEHVFFLRGFLCKTAISSGVISETEVMAK
ncbi:MAG: hypothetical protein NTX44_05755 [Ignavibacteriales bacterium]|nr:hypothetical protein [Ignavibacteriales bacterium]